MSDITTPIGTVCFPNLFRQRRNDLSGRDEYSVVLVFGPETDLSELKAACKAAVIKRWGEDSSKWPKLKSPIRPCEDYATTDEGGKTVYKAGFVKGGHFINVKNERPPGIVMPDGQLCTDPNAVYSGCKGRVLVQPFAYDQKGNKGVSLSLQHFQKCGDGDRIDGRIPVEKAFAPVVPTGAPKSGADMF